MFDKTLQELEQLSLGTTLPINMPLDGDRYFDRVCPNEDCQVGFKVLFEDWKEKVSNEAVYCPICRMEADSQSWNTPSQVEYINQTGLKYLADRIGNILGQDSQAYNKRQKAGFLKLSMSYKPGPPILVIPPSVLEAMSQKFVCEKCTCHYSSIGAAFFCPACGHNSSASIFKQSIDAVRQLLAALPLMKAPLSKDVAEDTVRMILESSMGKLVGSFQRMSEALLRELSQEELPTYPKNAFQNLDHGSKLWKKVSGCSYEDLVSKEDLSRLHLLFGRRHLLAHREGIVDQLYLDSSGDTGYRVDQRLVVSERDIFDLARLVEELASKLSGLNRASALNS